MISDIQLRIYVLPDKDTKYFKYLTDKGSEMKKSEKKKKKTGIYIVHELGNWIIPSFITMYICHIRITSQGKSIQYYY